ncbi:MAG: penicillin acylase family protein, partial [Nevskiales bacterium]
MAIGSNAVALGKNATANGRGMLLGNPHFPWQGSERFYQAHLTIPGRINVAGASLYGVPLILIGHTDSMAWSHTVSTAFRFTPYELTLVPGSPTSYLVDGQPEAMTAREVSVQALNAEGALETRTRTLYSTRYGPMLVSILGLPIFPWTPLRAFALADANAANYRYLNHFFEFNQAKSSRETLEILKRNQGIPWVNTIVSDKAGEAFYADISVTPNVPDAKAQICNTELGVATYELLGLPVLDGSRGDCAWDVDADAVQPGIFGPGNMPQLFRDDYVTNGNDSYWLSNPEEPLTGFARIIGDEETARSLRTRLGLVMVREQLADGGKFTRQQLQDMVFNNRQYAGELWRDALVGLCGQLPGGFEMSSAGPVDVSEACPV